MVARLYPGGPILDSAKLNPFWVQNAVDGYLWVVDCFDDSELWEVESFVKNLPSAGQREGNWGWEPASVCGDPN